MVSSPQYYTYSYTSVNKESFLQHAVSLLIPIKSWLKMKNTVPSSFSSAWDKKIITHTFQIELNFDDFKVAADWLTDFLEQ